jgi:hypothetical protein
MNASPLLQHVVQKYAKLLHTTEGWTMDMDVSVQFERMNTALAQKLMERAKLFAEFRKSTTLTADDIEKGWKSILMDSNN